MLPEMESVLRKLDFRNKRTIISLVCQADEKHLFLSGQIISKIIASFVGFSLIEVLIALFILSFGLLGIIELQVVAAKLNYEAYLRSVAVSRIISGHDHFQQARMEKSEE